LSAREYLQGTQCRCRESPSCRLPKKVVVALTAIVFKNNRRVACGRQRAPDLEKEERIRFALGVEIDRASQLCRRVKTIYSRRERNRTEIRTGQVAAAAWLRRGSSVCRGQIGLSLRRDSVPGVRRVWSIGRSRRKTSDSATRRNPHISIDGDGPVFVTVDPARPQKSRLFQEL